MTEYRIVPTAMYEIKQPTGPAVASEAPLPINNPVPTAQEELVL